MKMEKKVELLLNVKALETSLERSLKVIQDSEKKSKERERRAYISSVASREAIQRSATDISTALEMLGKFKTSLEQSGLSTE